MLLPRVPIPLALFLPKGMPMAKIRFSRMDPSFTSYADWNARCPEGIWRVVPPDEVRGLLPSGPPLEKCNRVFIMASGSPQVSAFMVNLHRVDFPDKAVDQEPFVVVFDHETCSASGGIVHHGNWKGRTEYPDEGFFAALAASGIQAYFPLKEVPTAGSGRIEDLPVDSSQLSAYWAGLIQLKKTRI